MNTQTIINFYQQHGFTATKQRFGMPSSKEFYIMLKKHNSQTYLQLVNDEYCERVTNSLKSLGSCNVMELIEDTGLTEFKVRKAIRILYDAGMIEKKRVGKAMIVSLVE